MLTGEKRRKLISGELKRATSPISAAKLAELCGVTRQIIVADIALMRAGGTSIRSECRGYVLENKEISDGITKKIVCRHPKENVRDEFYTIVDNGGRVLNVEVEHSIYSTISAELSISSRYDADEFVRAVESTGATQLSDLTGGVHIHTISVPDEAALERIEARLQELGILIKD